MKPNLSSPLTPPRSARPARRAAPAGHLWLAGTLAFALCVCLSPASAQESPPARKARAADPNEPVHFDGARTEIYKTVGDVKLRIFIFEPQGHKASDTTPAIVFFFGGGWTGGTPRQFEPQCRYLATRGMVAMTAEYRVFSRHGTLAVKCVEDAKSAIRWVRANAKRLGVDPKRIAAGGGSAGGHIAACAGVIEDFDAPDEDQSVSSVPNALVLFNPALVLGQVAGREPVKSERLERIESRLGTKPENLSPFHHIHKGAPPTLILHGKADTTVPYWTVEAFTAAMKQAGNRCELIGYEGQGHGFFNFGKGGDTNFIATTKEMDRFLVSLGYLKGSPTVETFLENRREEKQGNPPADDSNQP
jgi:acetyl esterase